MPASTRTAVVTLALMAAVSGACAAARANTLLIDDINASRATAAERPARGSTMTRVEARFGAPNARSSPVGKPPITRWEYPGFVVFFEYDHVIDSVRR